MKERNIALYGDVIWAHISNFHKIYLKWLQQSEEICLIDLQLIFIEIWFGFKVVLLIFGCICLHGSGPRS